MNGIMEAVPSFSPTNNAVAASPSVDFSVVIVAAGSIRGGGLVHAVAVKQPVQSWTVVRSNDDFKAVSNAMTSVLLNLPPCPSPSPSEDMGIQGIVRARNELQEWLNRVVSYPGGRENPDLRQFLTAGANEVPPQFAGVPWITFSPTPEAQEVHNPAEGPVDEMDMDEMFRDGQDDFDDDDAHEDDNDDDDEIIPASLRYQQTNERISEEEEMEIMGVLAGEIEMVDDVGSLAQSLGASHLGRSLQLQAQNTPNSFRPGPWHANETDSRTEGVQLGGAVAPTGAGALSFAMEQARGAQHQKPKVEGLSDSFCQKRPISAPRLDSFKMIRVIGKGSFGKVFLVREIKTEQMYALKVLGKDNIIKRNQVEHTKTERSVLGYVSHPFIVGMHMAFQSKDKLFFVLDYCAGGELFFHLGKVGKFPESRARFYASEIILAISYVHSLDIIYRDLKPENVLLDARGHVRLTDFGLSKEGISASSSGANSFCGTPEYLAPEILNRQGHGRAVDWWSLGALLYEMLTGLPPFYCQDRERLFEKIRRSDLNYPASLSRPAKTLLKGLLTRNPQERLGSGPNDAEDIQRDSFFEDIAWDRLAKGEIAPPWEPKISDSHDTRQFDKEFTSMPMGLSYQQSLGTTPADDMFKGFTFTDRALHGPGEGNRA